MDDDYNLFEDEFAAKANGGGFIVLNDVLKMNTNDEIIESKINLSHLRIIAY
jgi:hypothetical protein